MSEDWEAGADPWSVKSKTDIHRNDWFAVESNEVIRPDGSQGKYHVVRVRRLGVGVLPIENDGTVHMTGQWRFPLARYSWEIPMGGAESGETALDAAKRELSEESGITASYWVRLFEFDVSTSLTDERCVAFIATGLAHRKAHPEARERLARKRAPFLDVVERVEAGAIREVVTVAALMSAYRMAASGALPGELAAAMLGRARR